MASKKRKARPVQFAEVVITRQNGVTVSLRAAGSARHVAELGLNLFAAASEAPAPEPTPARVGFGG